MPGLSEDWSRVTLLFIEAQYRNRRVVFRYYYYKRLLLQYSTVQCSTVLVSLEPTFLFFTVSHFTADDKGP